MTSQGSSWQPNLRTERPSRHSKSINVVEKSVRILHKFVRSRLFEGQQMMILCCASNLALQATSFKSTSLDRPRSTRFGNMNVPFFCFDVWPHKVPQMDPKFHKKAHGFSVMYTTTRVCPKASWGDAALLKLIPRTIT